MNPRASSGLKKRCKHRGTEFTSSAKPIKPDLRVRRPRVAAASAEAQALRATPSASLWRPMEGGLKFTKMEYLLTKCMYFYYLRLQAVWIID